MPHSSKFLRSSNFCDLHFASQRDWCSPD